MNEKKLQKQLWSKYQNHKYRVINTKLFKTNEIVDFLSVLHSGYCQEIEVKISKGDFKADFKKPKHKLIRSKPSGWDRKVANRFYYAVPKGLLTIKDVPSYAGLIYVDRNSVVVVKKAPLLHKVKFDFRKILFNKVYYYYERQIAQKLYEIIW